MMLARFIAAQKTVLPQIKLYFEVRIAAAFFSRVNGTDILPSDDIEH